MFGTHQQAVLLGEAGAAVPQVLQCAQELHVLAHKEAVVSPALQNSMGKARRASLSQSKGAMAVCSPHSEPSLAMWVGQRGQSADSKGAG